MVALNYSQNILKAKIRGEIDHHTAAKIRTSIDGNIQKFMPKQLWLDFSGVRFMDSSGIGLIMGRYKQMSLIGGTLQIVNIPPHLQRIINLSGINTLGVVK